jgi:hypothetical protein
MLSLKSNPLTVNVCDAEAVPKQVVKLFNGPPETVIAATITIFLGPFAMDFIEVLWFWVLAKSKLVQKTKYNSIVLKIVLIIIVCYILLG